MKNIRTLTHYIYNINSTNFITFSVEPFSKILSFSINMDTLTMLYEYDSVDINPIKNKIININVLSGTFISTSILHNYHFHSTTSQTNTILNTISSGKSINFELNNINNFFHIFVEEIETISEIRDRKLNDIIAS